MQKSLKIVGIFDMSTWAWAQREKNEICCENTCWVYLCRFLVFSGLFWSWIRDFLWFYEFHNISHKVDVVIVTKKLFQRERIFAKDRNYLNHRKIRDWTFVKSGGKLPMIILIRNILTSSWHPAWVQKATVDGFVSCCQDRIFQLSDE